jgi:hypothetical protein
MATPGDHFKMPDGSVCIVRRTSAETDGEWHGQSASVPVAARYAELIASTLQATLGKEESP